jgi:C4-dicarboxylate-specific signal transduction histidine kinase
MINMGGVEAKTLAQLLLMQNIVLNLPDLKSINSFVCRGLKDMPGVDNVIIYKKNIENKNELNSCVYIPIEQYDTFYGEMEIQLNNPDEFAPYLDYVNNFVFMLGVILEERKQRAKNEQYQKDLEVALKNQKEASDELEAVNEELQVTNEELNEKNVVIEEKNNTLQTIIRHLKETQFQLLQAEKMASLGTLTAGVSHEINNPLQYLSGTYYALVNYFKKHGSNDEKTTSFLLSSTETAINRISSIVKGLNQFSRNNSKFDEDCDIHSIIDNCLTILHSQTKHGAEIRQNYNHDKIIVQGNVGKLHQVFINILTNAIQAIEEKGEITILTYLSRDNCIVNISDTGCGISEVNIPKITEPFFTTKDPGKGTGLGLSITYSIINDHKGNIQFESEENQGTKVIITLPLKH